MSAHQEILDARGAINRAIDARDADAIAAWLLPTYHVVTARSMHRDGREASAGSWSALFARDAASTHNVTTDELHINEGWGMAQEHGRWNGTITTREGPVRIAGVYAAKWHMTESGWRLEAEIFTPLVFEPLSSTT